MDESVNTEQGFNEALAAQAAKASEHTAAEEKTERRGRPEEDSPRRVVADVLGVGDDSPPSISAGLEIEGGPEPEIDFSDPAVQWQHRERTQELLGPDYVRPDVQRAVAAEAQLAEERFTRLWENGAEDDELTAAASQWAKVDLQGARAHFEDMRQEELEERERWFDYAGSDDEFAANYAEEMGDPTEADRLIELTDAYTAAEHTSALEAQIQAARGQLSEAETNTRRNALNELFAGVPDNQREALIEELAGISGVLSDVDSALAMLGGDPANPADRAFAGDLCRSLDQVPAEELGTHVNRLFAIHQQGVTQKVRDDFHADLMATPIGMISEGLETENTRLAAALEASLGDESPRLELTLDELRQVGAPKAKRVGDLRRELTSEPVSIKAGLTSNGKPTTPDKATGADVRFRREEEEEAARMRQLAGR